MLENSVEVIEIENEVTVSLVPIKTIIIALQAHGYMPVNPVEGVDLVDDSKTV